MPLAVLDKLNPVPAAFLKQARLLHAARQRRRSAERVSRSSRPTWSSFGSCPAAYSVRRVALRAVRWQRCALTPCAVGVGAGQRAVHPSRHAVCAGVCRGNCDPAARTRHGASTRTVARRAVVSCHVVDRSGRAELPLGCHPWANRRSRSGTRVRRQAGWRYSEAAAVVVAQEPAERQRQQPAPRSLGARLP